LAKAEPLACAALSAATSEFGQVEVAIDAAQEMILRDVSFETEGVKQPILPAVLPSPSSRVPGYADAFKTSHPRQRPIGERVFQQNWLKAVITGVF
jgi:hypothetical protein